MCWLVSFFLRTTSCSKTSKHVESTNSGRTQEKGLVHTVHVSAQRLPILPWPTSWREQSMCWRSPLRTVLRHRAPVSRICRRCSSWWRRLGWCGRCLFPWTFQQPLGCLGSCLGETSKPVSWEHRWNLVILELSTLSWDFYVRKRLWIWIIVTL